jgi:uncharacterized membrane protein
VWVHRPAAYPAFQPTAYGGGRTRTFRRTLRARYHGAADKHPQFARREAPHNHADQPDFARPKLHFVRARRLSAAPLGFFGGPMGKGRLEAFSDGVIAIIITIMVLEIRAPHGDGFDALSSIVPAFLSYVLSFVYVGIYWNNHHHMLQATHKITGTVLWANLHLLFWLSLFPFATAWMGENHFASNPTIAYGVVLLMAAVAYFVLQYAIIAVEGPGSVLKQALGRDWKGKASIALYSVAIGAAFWAPWLSQITFVFVALMWLVPDRRIERAISRQET